MHCGEYRELIAAHVDGLLAPEEEALATAHLATCPKCTQLLERERRFAHDLHARNLIHPTPPELRERVMAAIAAQDQPLSWTARLMQAWARPRYRAALAGALVVVMLMLVVPFLRHRGQHEHDVLHEVLEHYRQAEAQTITLEMKTDKPKVLEFFFADKGIESPTRTVIDLHGLGYKLVGGSVVPLGTATSAMMLYRGEKGFVLCHRFRATDLQLPPGGEVVSDDTYYSIDGLSICSYHDGEAVCMMASAMSVEELKKLLAGYI
jgi:anti-sigma factor RsiW